MKIFIKPFYYFVLFMLVWGNAYSTNYYVSATGNNSNNGLTTSTPWQSISKVNSMMSTFIAGDQILFKRGDTFFGTLTVNKGGLSGIDIVFGNYGTGSLPILTGKKPVTGWTVHSGNIYKATMSDTISNLYCNNNIQTVARFPNSGFMKIDAGNGANGFYDAALTQSAGYWNGANCRLRLINWSYVTRPVSSFSGGNVLFSSVTYGNVNQNYGYYFDNKLALLDIAGEWYQDKATNTVYLYAPGGVNPNSLSVEGVVSKKIITLNYNINYVKIQDLNISGCKDFGIEVLNGNTVTIQRCFIEHTGKFGINHAGVNCIIDNNSFADNLNSAINGSVTGGVIKNNTVRRTGLIPGYGVDDWGYIAFNLSSSTSLTVENNLIDSTGYTCLVSSTNFIIKNNVISNSLLILNDGAGIFIVSADGLQILNNVISNTMGNTESSAYVAYYANGIYVNGGVMNNTTIQGNTVSGCRNVGILIDIINASVNNKVIKNLSYNNSVSQILFTDYSSPSYIPNYNITVKGNTFYSLSAGQNCMEQMNFSQSSFSDWGTFDSNYYCNPYSELVIRKTKLYSVYSSVVYSLPLWRTSYSEDPASKTGLVSFSQYGITDTLSPNIIANSQFISDVSNWDTWPPAGSSISYAIHPAFENGCLRVRWNGMGYERNFTTANHFPITKGSYYLASISSVGVNNGTFSLWTFPSALPFNYFTYGTTRREHSYTFKADTTYASQSFSIQMNLPDTLLYFDNASLYKVSVDKLDSTQMSKLFVNESNFPQTFPLGGIAYQDINGNPVSGSIVLQPLTSTILINGNYLPIRNLQLKVLTEGLYNSGGDNMIPDTVRVYLRNSVSPYSIIDSSKGLLDANGNGSFNFPNASNSVSYYLSVEHRNSLETWSKQTVSFISNNLSYNFTVSADMAFGDNLKLEGSRYTIYSGDVNKDDELTLIDLIQTYNAGAEFATGYMPEDVNGSGTVDLNDITIVFNNAASFVSVIKP